MARPILLTPEVRARIHQRRREGDTYSTIARAVKLSIASIQAALRDPDPSGEPPPRPAPVAPPTPAGDAPDPATAPDLVALLQRQILALEALVSWARESPEPSMG